MAINIYNTKGEYDAAARPTTESSVSRISSTNEIEVDGVMVITRPCKGDICVLDSGLNARYIKQESFTLASLPSGWQAVGFVEWVRGNKVKVTRVVGTYKWAQYFLWKITGYTADGAEHAFSFAVKVSNVTYTCSGTYSGSDIDEVAASMNAIVSVFDFGGHSYHVYVRNGDLILQHDTYTTYLAVTATGVSVTQAVGPELTANSNMPRFNGRLTSEGATINLNRALIYFRADIDNASYNPTAEVTSLALQYPICLPAYLGQSAYRKDGETQLDYCSLLRETYGEGEEGWIRCISRGLAKYPDKRGVFDDYVCGDGKTNTYKLAGQKVQKANGDPDAFYPAFDAVAAVGFPGAKGLDKGDWYLPTIGEIFELKSGITYPAVYQIGVGSVSTVAASADPITRACAKLGMTQVQNSTYAWSSSRCLANLAWVFGGNNGIAGIYNYFYYAVQVVASALLSLREAQV